MCIEDPGSLLNDRLRNHHCTSLCRLNYTGIPIGAKFIKFLVCSTRGGVPPMVVVDPEKNKYSAFFKKLLNLSSYDPMLTYKQC